MVSPVKKQNGKCRDVKYTFPARKSAKSSVVKGSKPRPSSVKAKPFADRIIYLDLKSRFESAHLETALKSLGGVTAVFLDRSVTHLITDRIINKGLPGSSSVLSPVASISPRQNPYSPTASERSSLPRSRGVAMIERLSALSPSTYTDPVNLALQWGVPVLSAAHVWREILKIQEESAGKSPTTSKTSVRTRAHFVKIEPVDGKSKPDLLKLQAWPVFDVDSSDSPFQWSATACHGLNPPPKKGIVGHSRPVVLVKNF